MPARHGMDMVMAVDRPASNPIRALAGIHPPPWTEDALCAQTDPEAFYPEKGGSTREAKAICLTCDVRQTCLDYALDHKERFGIWGGMSERDRRKLKKTLPPVVPVVVRRKRADTDVSCPDCGRSFIHGGALGTHRKHAHPNSEKEPVMAEPQEQPQPSYAEQILAVMAATDGHPDPAVRAARKVVANALVALNRTLQARPAPAPAAVVLAKASAGSDKTAGKTRGNPHPVNNSHALRARVLALGVTPREIRVWCTSRGMDVPTRGALPGRLVDAYEAAHQQREEAQPA